MSEEQQEQQQEREGEEEGNAPLNEEVVADEDLGALGVIPEKAVEGPKEEEEEAKEEEEEAKEDEDAEEPIDPNDPVLEERRTYLRRIAAFFKELGLYYRGNRMPKGAAKAKAMKRFRLRGEELPANATYSENGETLTRLSRTGKLKDTITMQDYRPPTRDEQTAFDEKRSQIIRKAEKDYEAAIDELRRVEKTKVRGDIKQAQRAVAMADRHLYRSRYPEKAIELYKSVEIRQIDFDQPRNEHRVSVFALQVATRKRQDVYVVPEKAEEASVVEEESVKPKRKIIFAAKPVGEYDFLSSFYVHPFDYKGHRYTTAYQAMMATIASKFGNDETAKEIRAAAEAADIDLTWDKLVGVTHAAWNLQIESLSIKINRVKFAKGSELAAKLLKTGDAQIAAVPPEDETDSFQGIGLTEENPDSTKPSKWKGKNVFGLALEQIREELTVTAGANVATVATVATVAPVSEEPKKPKRLLRRLVPLSATSTVTNAATKGASVVANAATKGASVVANAATKGLSAAANLVTKGLSTVAEDATTVAKTSSSLVSNATAAAGKGVAAATAAAGEGLASAAEGIASAAQAAVKAVTPGPPPA
jgi:ribA/ribD-fused uncharacterized protein